MKNFSSAVLEYGSIFFSRDHAASLRQLARTTEPNPISRMGAGSAMSDALPQFSDANLQWVTDNLYHTRTQSDNFGVFYGFARSIPKCLKVLSVKVSSIGFWWCPHESCCKPFDFKFLTNDQLLSTPMFQIDGIQIETQNDELFWLQTPH